MKLIEISTRRRVTIAMFTVAILMFGSVSLSKLKINLLPDLSYPTLTIRTEYVGAAPAEIENLITKPVEEVLGVVKNVNELRSVSRAGQSDVILEFVWGTDMDFASLDVREKLDALQLPLEAERPVILRFDPSLDPIMRYGLRMKPSAGVQIAAEGDEPPVRSAVVQRQTALDENALKYLRRFADEEVKKDLESTVGVAAVKVSGGLEDEVQVLVDQDKLAQLRIPLQSLIDILGAENVNLSGGRLEQGTQQYLVRTLNQFEAVEEIADVIISQENRRPVYLRDVATVQLGYKEREAINRINGVEAVEIAIYKEGNANTVSVADDVKLRVEELRGQKLAEDMELIPVYDQSTFISNAVDEVVNAAIIGGILAILILYFFLRDFASTAIISLSIPVSVIATFNLMYGYDITLNIMSLGGLALGIGLLVDNSIVVLENVARHREMGKERPTAAKDGASEVATAVIASTLTTVAVFLPLVFVKGIAGQLFRDQALTVTFSLLASLLVAITLIPMLSSLGKGGSEAISAPELAAPRTRIGRVLRTVRLFLFSTVPGFLARMAYLGFHGAGWLLQRLFWPFVYAFNALYDVLARMYPGMLAWALRHRATVLAVAFLMFGASILLVPRLGVEFIPPLAQGEFDIEFRMSPGTPLERTDAVMKSVQDVAADVSDIQTTFAAVGSGNRMDANPDEGGENWGELHVQLKRKTDSDRQTSDDAEAEELAFASLRSAMESIPDLQYKFSRPTLFTLKTPIEIEVSGYSLDHLKMVSNAIALRMGSSERFVDVKSTMEQGHPEVQILFDRERAAALGLAVHEIARIVVNQVRGEVATKYSWHNRKIDILVRAREEDRASIERIRSLIINAESARPVPLSAVADITVDIGPSEIRRVGQQRVAIVSANLAYGDLGAAALEIEDILEEVAVPQGLSVRLSGQSEEMDVSFRSLIFALLLAVFLVYLVMASQFESLVHPFVIFFSIPLAVIGAVLALWLTGATISVVVFIGLILLAGIVVNNAIVLVDLINQLRADGMHKLEAIREAARLRLRPILMTTLTTCLGLLPLALGIGEGAEIRAPMGITVIGGLTVSTLLTLVVIPVMYSIIDRRPEVAPASTS
jgi:HAE1 family hydrophobic/amphiphilic exporter-1